MSAPNPLWDGPAGNAHALVIEPIDATNVRLDALAWDGSTESLVAGGGLTVPRSSLAALASALVAGSGTVAGITIASTTYVGRATLTMTSGAITYYLDDVPGGYPGSTSYARDMCATALQGAA